MEQTHPLIIVVASTVQADTLNVQDVLTTNMLKPTAATASQQQRRKLLENNDAAATPTLTLLGVRNSPGIMGGLLSGVFLSMTLWIAVTCLATVESAPMMVNSPPGPKDGKGDPQFIGTPREGTRYYPYMNQPVKEN